LTTLTPTWAFDDSVIPDMHGRAARMLQFADLLRHPKAVGNDRRPLPYRWQRRIVERIFGPTTVDGRREVSTVFALIPRGARKTTFASVLALGHCIGPEQRPGGQVVSAASDRTQARLAFDEASAMISADQRLVAATRIRDTKNKIEHLRSRSSYVAVSADGDAQHGKSPSFVLADEVHCWRGFGLYNALRTGASKTPGSLFVIITTSGRAPEGVAWELLRYAKRVAANPEKDPTFLPILFAADDDADWEDEDIWHTVNPGLADGFPDLNELRSEAKLARELPRLRQAFKQVHLNIWTDDNAAGWIEMSALDDGGAPMDIANRYGEPCVVTIDMSKSYDLTAVSATFRDEDGGYSSFSFPFITGDALKRRAMEQPDVPWQQWADDGHLAVIRGALIDDDVIEGKILEIADVYDVKEIGFDPKFAAKIAAKMLSDGYPVVEVPQRPLVLGPYYVELQRAILARKFRWGGHPVLRHCVASAVPIAGDTGLVYMSKSRSTDAIDQLVAAAMGVGRALAMTGGDTRSIYDRDELWQPEADHAARSDGKDGATDEIDHAILADPSHPRWQEMRERYEAQFGEDDHGFF
jgi:phage terminase large subunit-like protein